jgi:hypothetical protein
MAVRMPTISRARAIRKAPRCRDFTIMCNTSLA